MEELLPPQHIELAVPSGGPTAAAGSDAFITPLSTGNPEPLINDTSEPAKPAQSTKNPKGPNPTNNPIFAQRLDEFEY